MKLLPRGHNDWEQVKLAYDAVKPVWWSERDLESLRSKFKTLRSTKKPTGSQTIPTNVSTAKKIVK